MEHKARIKKKYPILTYLCCLLVVSVLFTGVTFSRYTISSTGNIATPVALYDCSYSINDISSTAFPNIDYWLTSNGNQSAISTARTVRFTMRNYTQKVHTDGTPYNSVSGVDVQGHIRFYLPAEIADNLAIQVAEVDENDSVLVRSPEIVLGELIYNADSGDGYVDGNLKDYGDGTRVNTNSFKDYFDNGNTAVEEYLFVSGGFGRSGGKLGGTISAYEDNDGDENYETDTGTGINFSITASTVSTPYSIGFQRGESATDYESQLFLDLEEDIDYYTIDINLPSMHFIAEVAQQHTYVLYLTLTERLNDGDFSALWQLRENEDIYEDNATVEYAQRVDKTSGASAPVPVNEIVVSGEGEAVVYGNNDLMITAPETAEYYYTYLGARVTGYHFTQTARFTDVAEGELANTTVRVNCEYNGTGGYNLTLSHVAPISEDSTASYVHPITFSINGAKYSEDNPLPYTYSAGNTIEGMSTGTCNNQRYIDLSDIIPDPFAERVQNFDGSTTLITFHAYKVLAKSYDVRLTALFVQASET